MIALTISREDLLRIRCAASIDTRRLPQSTDEIARLTRWWASPRCEAFQTLARSGGSSIKSRMWMAGRILSGAHSAFLVSFRPGQELSLRRIIACGRFSCVVPFEMPTACPPPGQRCQIQTHSFR